MTKPLIKKVPGGYQVDGLKLRSNVGQTKMDCRLIAVLIFKIQRVAFIPAIQTKEGGDHAFNSSDCGFGRSWCYSLPH
jgi:hypothetical protein